MALRMDPFDPSPMTDQKIQFSVETKNPRE